MRARILGISSWAVILACNGTQKSFDVALESWRGTAPASYTFEYAWHCFCRGAGAWWRVTVDSGRVVTSTVVDSTNVIWQVVPPRGGPPTIDSLFQQVRTALDESNASVAVRYDSSYHYPRELQVDRDKGALDDEWGFTVRYFKIGPQ